MDFHNLCHTVDYLKNGVNVNVNVNFDKNNCIHSEHFTTIMPHNLK